jgi:hypothetical protein
MHTACVGNCNVHYAKLALSVHDSQYDLLETKATEYAKSLRGEHVVVFLTEGPLVNLICFKGKKLAHLYHLTQVS